MDVLEYNVLRAVCFWQLIVTVVFQGCTIMSEFVPASNFIPKRGLTAEEAADYCGLSVSGFRHWVSTGKLPCKIMGTNRYDLKAIDQGLDKLSGLQTSVEPTEDTPEAAFDRCFGAE